MSFRLLRRLVTELPRYGKLTYCLYRDPRIPQRNKMMLTGALVAIYNPVIDFPLWFPVVGEMDALALTVLAVKMFIDRAPAEIVAEHQRRIGLGSSSFDQDLREGLRGLRGRAGYLLETGRERLRERLRARGANS